MKQFARITRLAAALCCALSLAACAETDAPVEAPSQPEPVATAREWLPLKLDGHEMEAQIAVTGPEQQKGLMHRKSLGENRGMLFVNKQPKPLSFWMRNTHIPLSIAYIGADGKVREIHRLQPLDETPVHSDGYDMQFALEMNQGWFRERGIRAGAQLDLSLVAEALRKRGFDPADYGL